MAWYNSFNSDFSSISKQASSTQLNTAGKTAIIVLVSCILLFAILSSIIYFYYQPSRVRNRQLANGTEQQTDTGTETSRNRRRRRRRNGERRNNESTSVSYTSYQDIYLDVRRQLHALEEEDSTTNIPSRMSMSSVSTVSLSMPSSHSTSMRSITCFVPTAHERLNSLLQKQEEIERSMIVFQYSESSSNDHDDVCPVCLEQFESESQLCQIISCAHVGHASCFRLWFAKALHPTCPVCRLNLESPQNDSVVQI